MGKKLCKVHAVINKNEADRESSSSGGMFSLIAEYVLGQGGIVYGAAYDENFKVHHIGIETKTELGKLRGAKYSVSDLGNCYSEITEAIASGRTVLFSGTPCQVFGLKNHINNKINNEMLSEGRSQKNLIQNKLILIDFVCRGIPVSKAWEAYVSYRAGKDANGEYPTGINLRSKRSRMEQIFILGSF